MKNKTALSLLASLITMSSLYAGENNTSSFECKTQEDHKVSDYVLTHCTALQSNPNSIISIDKHRIAIADCNEKTITIYRPDDDSIEKIIKTTVSPRKIFSFCDNKILVQDRSCHSLNLSTHTLSLIQNNPGGMAKNIIPLDNDRLLFLLESGKMYIYKLSNQQKTVIERDRATLISNINPNGLEYLDKDKLKLKYDITTGKKLLGTPNKPYPFVTEYHSLERFEDNDHSESALRLLNALLYIGWPNIPIANLSSSQTVYYHNRTADHPYYHHLKVLDQPGPLSDGSLPACRQSIINLPPHHHVLDLCATPKSPTIFYTLTRKDFSQTFLMRYFPWTGRFLGHNQISLLTYSCNRQPIPSSQYSTATKICAGASLALGCWSALRWYTGIASPRELRLTGTASFLSAATACMLMAKTVPLKY